MTTGLSSGELSSIPKSISLDRLLDACEAAGRNPIEVIALALTDEARDLYCETGMTLKEQSKLAVQLVNKVIPDLKAVEHSGSEKKPVRFIIEG